MENDKATEEWLNAQKKSTKPVYKTYWSYFLEFTGLTGDQILESRKADKEFAWQKRVMEFKNWLISKGQSDNSAKTASNTVRGFFALFGKLVSKTKFHKF